MSVAKTCPVCGTAFQPTNKKGGHVKACSDGCAAKMAKTTSEKCAGSPKGQAIIQKHEQRREPAPMECPDRPNEHWTYQYHRLTPKHQSATPAYVVLARRDANIGQRKIRCDNPDCKIIIKTNGIRDRSFNSPRAKYAKYLQAAVQHANATNMTVKQVKCLCEQALLASRSSCPETIPPEGVFHD